VKAGCGKTSSIFARCSPKILLAKEDRKIRKYILFSQYVVPNLVLGKGHSILKKIGQERKTSASLP
jgi:hypothetical protein